MSSRRGTLIALALLAIQPFATALAQQTFPEWTEEYMERRALGITDVDLYIKVLEPSLGPLVTVPGATGVCVSGKICQGYDVEHDTLDDGTTPIVAERPKSPEEMGVEAGVTSSALLQSMGQGLVDSQLLLNRYLFPGSPTTEGAFAAKLNADLQTGDVFPQGLLINPTTMFAMGGYMLLHAAEGVRAAERASANSATLARADFDAALDVYRRAVFAGTEPIGNVTASLYQASNLGDLGPLIGGPSQAGGDSQADDDMRFLPDNVKLWVDSENHRFLKQRMEGTAVAEGESRDFYIEVEYSDFRNPPGCGQMDEPFTRTMRMGGMLDEKEMAEMEEARAQLAEFEQQLASMPAQQRQMMERAMGSQLETMRNLINAGALEYVEQTEQILCNPNLSSLFRMGPEPESDQNLVRRIQEYLVILGYEPGNIDGELDVLTQIAISEFQAAQGLPVTGEPSEELAGVLAMLVEGQ